ncbi:esterase [Mycolicibacterium agri]|uniref:Esterase n=1 Tax=Mycolicibacterium agri TaxID=36811 RepID=A0A2A7N6H9_MYCAG|nr:alpha/beta fold hydrolase [Mycolicibacterium agri]PEG39494.1 esterase [Mycolicibacterium agri]GFG48680.1 hypothetical protein MAGR_01210 [Mycolicibacterium agri]
MQTVEYAPGRFVDVFGEAGRPVVLVWHGMQSNARASVRPLASLIAEHGLAVLAPDWNSAADDNGRGDLLASVRFAQDRAQNDSLVVVGWSMGGVAAAGLAINAAQHDVRIRHTVCLAGAFMAADPISGRVPATDMPGSAEPSPFTLLHGVGDDVVPVSASREFAAVLEKHQWPVESAELDADHASIAGAGYDPVAGRYFPAEDPGTLAVAADVADRIASVCR